MIRPLLSACLLLGPAAGLRAADPMERELQRLTAMDNVPVKRISAKLGSVRLVALTTRAGGRDDLRVYRVDAERAKLIHLEPGFGKTLSFAAIHDAGGIPDLAGDGSRIVAYRVEFRGAGQEKLVLLRYAGGGIKRVAELPFGRFEDFDADGKPEIVSRSRPLGQWFQIECESFHSMADAAFRTTIHGWKGAELVSVSKRYPDFYREEIRRREAELAGVSPRGTEDYGGYLGSALSLYFDYAEIGQGQTGWKKFTALFPVRAIDPPPVKRCAREMEATLRERLGIPEGW